MNEQRSHWKYQHIGSEKRYDAVWQFFIRPFQTLICFKEFFFEQSRLISQWNVNPIYIYIYDEDNIFIQLLLNTKYKCSIYVTILYVMHNQKCLALLIYLMIIIPLMHHGENNRHICGLKMNYTSMNIARNSIR